MPFFHELSTMKFTEWITLVGAVVAGLTGVFNLLMLAKNRFDHIKVGTGPASPNVNKDRVDVLHVINCCDHSVKIADYGFISDDFQKESVAYTLSNHNLDIHEQEYVIPISTTLQVRGAEMDAGYDCKRKVIAVYARTNMQSFYRIKFHSGTKIKDRLLVWLKFLWPKYRY
ncbi:Uncharacterised protein [Serratia fonticola]|nr:Uncharacterised protein [Serratia fonticola]